MLQSRKAEVAVHCRWIRLPTQPARTPDLMVSPPAVALAAESYRKGIREPEVYGTEERHVI